VWVLVITDGFIVASACILSYVLIFIINISCFVRRMEFCVASEPLQKTVLFVLCLFCCFDFSLWIFGFRTEGEGALSQVWTKADKHREAFDCVRMSAFAIWLPTADFVTNAFIRCLNTNATYECDYITLCYLLAVQHVQLQSLRDGSAVGRWTCDLQVAGSIPSWSAFT